MNGISSGWNCLVPEMLAKIAVTALVNKSDVAVYTFARVCRAWRAALDTNAFASSVVAHTSSYPIDFSSDQTDKEKLWRIIDFQSLLYSDAVNKMAKELPLYRQYMTPYKIAFIVDSLIDRGEFETVARFLRCKIELSSMFLNQIAKKLDRDVWSKVEKAFCFGLLIKCHYDLSSFFKTIHAHDIDPCHRDIHAFGSRLIHIIASGVDITLADFEKSGVDITAFEECSAYYFSNVSPLSGILRTVGKMSASLVRGQPFHAFPFKDTTLSSYYRADSYEHIKEFLWSVALKCNMNIQLWLPPTDDPLASGQPALHRHSPQSLYSHFRAVSIYLQNTLQDTLQIEENVISEVFAEVDICD